GAGRQELVEQRRVDLARLLHRRAVDRERDGQRAAPAKARHGGADHRIQRLEPGRQPAADVEIASVDAADLPDVAVVPVALLDMGKAGHAGDGSGLRHRTSSTRAGATASWARTLYSAGACQQAGEA